jgi:hypothetical protein
MERRNVSGTRGALAPSTVGTCLGTRVMGGNAWRAPGAPIQTQLSRPSPNRPARVAQSSDEGVEEADPGRASHGPRFVRFAAAMDASPASQDQFFARSPRRIRPPEPVHSVSGIQWLGIGSWAFFCVALFVSMLPHPVRDAVDRSTGLQADHSLRQVVVRDVPPTADPMPLPSNSREVAIRPPARAAERGG